MEIDYTSRRFSLSRYADQPAAVPLNAPATFRLIIP
jgi:hypothetical protein